MFSIIIPLYNKENYIKRALISVLKQTFNEFEVIIVNDGSTDSSMEIIKDIKDDRIKIFSQENRGVSSARNAGINNAVFQYVAFLDADDTWHPSFLMSIKYLIETFPEAGAYYSNYKIVHKTTEENNLKEQRYENILVNDYFEFALTRKYISSSSIVVKKDVFETIGKFPEEYTRGEDLYLWTKLGLKHKIAYTSKIGAFYYRNIPNSLTKRKFNLEDSFSNSAEEFYVKYKNIATNNDSFEKYMLNIFSSKAKYLIVMNRNREARIFLRKYLKSINKKVIIYYILSFMPNKVTRILTK